MERIEATESVSEELILRAKSLLFFMPEEEAAKQLQVTGVSNEHAYLAVKAGSVLNQE